MFDTYCALDSDFNIRRVLVKITSHKFPVLVFRTINEENIGHRVHGHITDFLTSVFRI